MFNFFSLIIIYTMLVKKRSKKVKQVGGYFWERNDPIFGASNRWIGDEIINPTNKLLKKRKYYQQ